MRARRRGDAFENGGAPQEMLAKPWAGHLV
jgi:hypothetical protein